MKTTKQFSKPIFVIVMLALVSACGGVIGSTTTAKVLPEEPELTGDINRGRAIFNGEVQINAFVPCSTCHYVERHNYPLLGPDMVGVPRRAAGRIPGLSAAEYIRRSIVEPDFHVVENYPASTMNPGYAERLTQQDVNDLVAFLMSL
jgi:cytochrome c2